MITWNEEALLETAISSVKGLADEIVVGDTISDDDTVMLARRLGCKVLTGLDRYHKGQSRNAVIEVASGDWIIILDADETIADPAGVRAYLEDTKTDAAYIRLCYKDSKNRTTLDFSQMRIWRKGTYLYKYRAHEVPIPQKEGLQEERTQFVWEHRPIPQRNDWKYQYTLKRLFLDVKENPESSRAKFYLARQYIYLEDWQKAIEAFEAYQKQPDHNQADAYLYTAKAFGELGEEQRQIAALYSACAVNPCRRDWWGQLGEIYYQRKQYAAAAAVLKCALEFPRPSSDYVYGKWYGAQIYDLLARCYYYVGRVNDGLPYMLTAVSLEPSNSRLQNNLRYFIEVPNG